MKKKLFFAVFSIILTLSGCGIGKIPPLPQDIQDQQSQSVLDKNFDLKVIPPEGFHLVEGTSLGMKNSVVVGDQVFTTLSFTSNKPGLARITFEGLENKQGLSLDKFIMNILPNRDLYPSDDTAYWTELKKGMEHINGSETEAWMQTLSHNINGYEAFAYVMNPQKNGTVVWVNWEIVPPTEDTQISKIEAELQYDQLKQMITKMKIQ